jgi:hypothetical protein
LGVNVEEDDVKEALRGEQIVLFEILKHSKKN